RRRPRSPPRSFSVSRRPSNSYLSRRRARCDVRAAFDRSSPVEPRVVSAAKRLPGLSASFPAHNEEDNVRPMIAALPAVLPDVADRFEIIVVDDGSRDATYQRASAIAENDPRIRVVRHPVNRGYGAAVWTGLSTGTLEYAFFTDGDRQFDVRQITDLIAKLDEGYDVVVGYRVDRKDNAIRIANAHAWNWLIRTLLHVPVRDVDCAFKLFDRRVLQ